MDVLNTHANRMSIDELKNTNRGTLKNKVVNVSLAGGLVGLFISPRISPRKKIEEKINSMNAQGYKFVYSLGANSNIIFLGFAVFVLVITFFIYMPLPSYMLVFEKVER